MATEYRIAPGRGCQLNSGRLSEVVSPMGASSANPLLASGVLGEGAEGSGGTAAAATRVSLVWMLGAVTATGGCATDVATEVLSVRGFSYLNQRAAETAATKMAAIDRASGNENLRRRLLRPNSRGLVSGREKVANSPLKARRSSSSARQASHESR